MPDMSLRGMFYSGGRKNANSWLYLLCFIFKVLVDAAYGIIIANVYAYYKFADSFTILACFFSWAVFYMGLKLMSCNVIGGIHGRSLSREIVFILFILAFTPFTTMVEFGNFNIPYIILGSIYWLTLFFAQKRSLKRKTHKRFKIADNLPWNLIIIALSLICCADILYVSGKYGGFNLNFVMSEVYTLRAEAKLNSMPWIIYEIFSISRALGPLFIAYFIYKRNIPMAALCFICQMLSFGYDGMKTTFFTAVIALVINILPSTSLKKINRIALIGVCCVTFFSTFLYLINGNVQLSSMFVRRTMFMPARISYYYFDFFTEHVPDFFRRSLFGKIGFPSPYPSLSTMISQIYSNRTSVANCGLIADAMTNLGYIGIIVSPVLLVLVLRFLDNCSEGLDQRMYLSIAVTSSINIINSFLLTALFTHGLFFAALVMLLIKKAVQYDKRLQNTDRV